LDLFEEEKQFFKIPESRQEEEGSQGSIEEVQVGGFLGNCSPKIKRKGWELFRTIMDPTFSKAASIWHTLDIIFICISITFMVLETDPVVGHYFVFPSDEDHLVMVGVLPVNNIIFGIESLLILFFTVDIIIRFITWPGFLTFWKNIFNILDILSIVPYYISLVAHSMHSEHDGDHDDEVVKQKYFILKMCRIFRIVRVFKFVKHSKDLIVIVKVLLSSRKELGLLVILLGISTVTFGSIMFYVEHESNAVMFDSIMTGCWWALVTITTLGYGDIHPVTVGGKVIGSALLTFGMVFLTLPMTIIVSKFGSVYERENRKLYKRKEVAESVCNSKEGSSSNINNSKLRA
jgi:potassium voltage-gated channel Shaker-related subfamily A protein 3